MGVDKVFKIFSCFDYFCLGDDTISCGPRACLFSLSIYFFYRPFFFPGKGLGGWEGRGAGGLCVLSVVGLVWIDIDGRFLNITDSIRF